MSQELPKEIADVAAQIRSAGGFPILVTSTDAGLSFVVFQRPTILVLSDYVAKASDATVGPLVAAIGLCRITAKFPAPDALRAIEVERPFVIMRCVQAMLADLGLSAKAQKKSL